MPGKTRREKFLGPVQSVVTFVSIKKDREMWQTKTLQVAKRLSTRAKRRENNLTFCEPCIVIYLRNKGQQDELSSLNLFQ